MTATNSLLPPPLGHVGRNGPGRPGKADQRGLLGQGFGNPGDSLIDRCHAFVKTFQGQAFQIAGAADGIENGPLAFLESDMLCQPMWNDQDIGEQNGRIHAIAPDGLQRHFAGEFRRETEIEESAGLSADLPVFRQIPTRLTHQPEGRFLQSLTAQGA